MMSVGWPFSGHIEELSVSVADILVNLDGPALAELVHWFVHHLTLPSSLVGRTTPRTVQPDRQGKQRRRRESKGRIFLDSFSCNNPKITFSTYSVESLLPVAFWNHLCDMHVVLQLPKLDIKDEAVRPIETFVVELLLRTLPMILWQIPFILGDAPLLGSPARVVRSLIQGFSDAGAALFDSIHQHGLGGVLEGATRVVAIMTTATASSLVESLTELLDRSSALLEGLSVLSSGSSAPATSSSWSSTYNRLFDTVGDTMLLLPTALLGGSLSRLPTRVLQVFGQWVLSGSELLKLQSNAIASLNSEAKGKKLQKGIEGRGLLARRSLTNVGQIDWLDKIAATTSLPADFHAPVLFGARSTNRTELYMNQAGLVVIEEGQQPMAIFWKHIERLQTQPRQLHWLSIGFISPLTGFATSIELTFDSTVQQCQVLAYLVLVHLQCSHTCLPKEFLDQNL